MGLWLTVSSQMEVMGEDLILMILEVLLQILKALLIMKYFIWREKFLTTISNTKQC